MSYTLRHNWGFGMSPLSKSTATKNQQAVEQIHGLLLDSDFIFHGDISESMSVLKGMVNRILRQDQWDWFTVYSRFGYPQYNTLKKVSSALASWRSEGSFESKIQSLNNSGIILMLKCYLNENIYKELNSDIQYLYVLSTREQPSRLKIGRTNREVIKRLNEINSATGVDVPYAVRALFKVTDSVKAEKIVHGVLDRHRLRKDREFFDLNFREASQTIRTTISENNLAYKQKGKVTKFDERKDFGFIESNGYSFFFSKNTDDTISFVKNHSIVYFDYSANQRGFIAFNLSTTTESALTEDQ